MRTAERKNIPCENCGTMFETMKDHGVWKRFCNRDCFLTHKSTGVIKECETCGKEFKTRKSIQGKRISGFIYCSKECYTNKAKTGEYRNCIVCGKEYYITNAALRQRNQNKCCSNKCRSIFYTKDKSPGWKRGSYIHTQSDERHILKKDDRFSGKYRGEHRIVAESVLGRNIRTDEPVIRLDKNRRNNRPDNLYICGSMSECKRILSGSLPYPNRSNII